MLAWFGELNAKERRTMGACFGGWALDAFDVQMYSFVIPTVIALWGLSRGEAGLIGTVTLLISSLGGWFSGTLADRFGRVRMLQITILWYSIFTFLCAFAQNFEQLFILRALHGFGFGGEWAAGAVLMGEVIRDKYRGRGVGIVQTGWAVGWGASALVYTALYAFLPEAIAWRVLFAVGLLPAVFVFWIRRHIDEPEIFRDRQRERPPVECRASVLGVPRAASVDDGQGLADGHRRSGRRLCARASGCRPICARCAICRRPAPAAILLVQILGALLGFLLGAYLSDVIGRKCDLHVVGDRLSFIGILLYMFLPMGNTALLFFGVPLFVVFLMKFPPMGPFMTELFPTAVRGTAQGFCYNAGRAIGSFFPAMVGLSEPGHAARRGDRGIQRSRVWADDRDAVDVPETRGRSLASLETEPARMPGAAQ